MFVQCGHIDYRYCAAEKEYETYHVFLQEFDKYQNERAPFCQLKIVPDLESLNRTCPGRVMSETHDDDGVEYEFIHLLCPGCANIITQERKGQKENLYRPKYCQDCGQRLDWEGADR